MNGSRGIQKKSADTSVIENRLRKTSVGDLVSYDELSKLLGRDVREFCIGSLRTARHTLIAESIFFDVVSKEGYLRISQEDATHAAKSYVSRARKAASRGIRHLSNVQFNELSDEAKRENLATAAQLGAVKLFSSSVSAKKLEEKIDGQTSPLPIGETLKLFGG